MASQKDMEAFFSKRLTESARGNRDAAAGSSSAGTKRPISACCNAQIRREKCTNCHSMVNKAARILPNFSAGAPSRQAAKANSGGTGQWMAEHDAYLWAHQNDPVSALAAHFSRSTGGVESRLKHLKDPTHAAYQRLHNGGTAAARSTGAASKRRTLDSALLNNAQQSAVRAASAGESFFLTGGAGTGKSFTLSHIVQALEARHGQRGVFVTGSTGIAACHVGGTTLHSFAGIGLGKEDVATLVSRVLGNRNAAARWQECRALVIDEVSMLDGDLFDKLEAIARRLLDPVSDRRLERPQLHSQGRFTAATVAPPIWHLAFSRPARLVVPAAPVPTASYLLASLASPSGAALWRHAADPRRRFLSAASSLARPRAVHLPLSGTRSGVTTSLRLFTSPHLPHLALFILHLSPPSLVPCTLHPAPHLRPARLRASATCSPDRSCCAPSSVRSTRASLRC